MKFIHIADIHLGAAPDLGRPWSKARAKEIWDTFSEVVAVCNRDAVDVYKRQGGRYAIGDEIASWSGSNWGTQNRRIKPLDYDNIQPGSYNGIINYSISLENQ